jgi:hypothetical protein
MFHKRTIVLVVVIISLVIVIPVLALAPAEGTVFEGFSVPGVELGYSRSQVEAAWGLSDYCTDRPYYDGQQGLDGICQFDVVGVNNGGDQVTVYFLAPDGGPAQASTDDVVTSIQWYTVISGWVTTAGVNTTLAKNDPQAVIDAYPNAEVTYYDSGYVHEVLDPEMGISIVRDWNVYGAFTTVRMMIFTPYTPPPPPPSPDMIRVADIEMTIERRSVIARVLVLDDQDQPVEGALVDATWYYPKVDGLQVNSATASDGYATFRVDKARRGNYYLYINDVTLEDYVYDYINSTTLGVTSKSK